MEDNFEIPVLYQDNEMIVVDKPVDLAVHKNDFMRRDAPYLTKLVGESTGRRIYNVHRLDAKTSGVIVLAFSSEMARELTLMFERREVRKMYYAIVQGVPGEGTFSGKVLVKKRTKFKKPAVTHFKTLRSARTAIIHKEELTEPVTLSLVEISPETGRWHQLRQHFAQNRFDILGDSHHGDFKLNKEVTHQTGMKRLFLHATELEFEHPQLQKKIHLKSPLPAEFDSIMNLLGEE